MLYAHDNNPEIAAQRTAWVKRLPNATMVPMLPVSEVVHVGKAPGHTHSAEWMPRLHRPLRPRSRRPESHRTLGCMAYAEAPRLSHARRTDESDRYARETR